MRRLLFLLTVLCTGILFAFSQQADSPKKKAIGHNRGSAGNTTTLQLQPADKPDKNALGNSYGAKHIAPAHDTIPSGSYSKGVTGTR